MTIEGVGLFGPLEPVDDQVRQGCGDYLVANLEEIAGGHDVQQGAGGIDASEGQGDDKNRVHGLADDSGADRARPELAAIGKELQPRHSVRVGEFAGPEGDEAGRKDARDEAEDGGEGLLIAPAGGGRERDNDGADNIQQRGAEEAQPDGAARGGVAVDLGEDVSEDVGYGEKKHGAADRKGADETDLLRDQVGDEQDDHERSGEGVEVFVTACSRAHGFVLDGLALQWFQYQYAVCERGTVNFFDTEGLYC